MKDTAVDSRVPSDAIFEGIRAINDAKPYAYTATVTAFVWIRRTAIH